MHTVSALSIVTWRNRKTVTCSAFSR